MTTVLTAREVAERLRQRLAALDLSGFTDLFADDAVFEYPFGFPGAPDRFTDRETLRAHLVDSRRGVPNLIKVDAVDSVVHETADPEVLVLETEVSGHTIATGEPFRFASGVGILRARNGQVVHYRDYTNAIGAARATGQLAQLAAGLAVAS